MNPIHLELSEWCSAGPDSAPQLRHLNLDGEMGRAAAGLGHRLRIKELRAGIQITSNSHVGRISLGPLRVHVKPKLPALELLELLRYACGIRDVRVLPQTSAPMRELGLQELLVSLLAAEVRDLLRFGLSRRYIRRKLELDSPRGQIDFDQLVRQGGIMRASLPCVVDQRDPDWHLNRVIVAGLHLAGRLTEDLLLRRELQQLISACVPITPLRLNLGTVDSAILGLTRQTGAWTNALELIRLLVQARGVDPDSSEEEGMAPGYLFDMNMFFQRLLSRFFHEHLSGLRIVDEHSIRGVFSYAANANPQRRNIRSPRPDYALYRQRALLAFMDAKYRDLWTHKLPREWLYQLGLYAACAPQRHALVLYATTSEEAQMQRIVVQHPTDTSPHSGAAVTLRPVVIPRLVRLLSDRNTAALRGFANELVAPFQA
jgi:5-methylcytosine-specific restriction enzyme subunit McrC